MITPSPFNTMVQSIAALLIFVIGYFALLFSVIACVVTAALISKGARLLWSYSIGRMAPADRVPGAVIGEARLMPCRIDTMCRPVAAAQRSGPENMIRVNPEL